MTDFLHFLSDQERMHKRNRISSVDKKKLKEIKELIYDGSEQ